MTSSYEGINISDKSVNLCVESLRTSKGVYCYGSVMWVFYEINAEEGLYEQCACLNCKTNWNFHILRTMIVNCVACKLLSDVF